jgi:hypothetical protein
VYDFESKKDDVMIVMLKDTKGKDLKKWEW